MDLQGGPTFEDLSIDDELSQLERVVRYSTSSIALQRLVHVKVSACVRRTLATCRSRRRHRRRRLISRRTKFCNVLLKKFALSAAATLRALLIVINAIKCTSSISTPGIMYEHSKPPQH